jgi:hypothetical protein
VLPWETPETASIEAVFPPDALPTDSPAAPQSAPSGVVVAQQHGPFTGGKLTPPVWRVLRDHPPEMAVSRRRADPQHHADLTERAALQPKRHDRAKALDLSDVRRACVTAPAHWSATAQTNTWRLKGADKTTLDIAHFWAGSSACKYAGNVGHPPRGLLRR